MTEKNGRGAVSVPIPQDWDELPLIADECVLVGLLIIDSPPPNRTVVRLTTWADVIAARLRYRELFTVAILLPRRLWTRWTMADLRDAKAEAFWAFETYQS